MNSNREDFFTFVGQTSDESLALEIVGGKGAKLFGPDGTTYLDFISGICVSNLGHGDPDILQAIEQQNLRYLHPIVYGEGVFSPQVQYAKKLVASLDESLDNVYYTNSGSEAIEAAMKIAKKYTGRRKLVACHNAYHGSTQGALSLSGDPGAKAGYGPLLPDIVHVTYNDFDDLAQITEDTAAFFVEPIQGAGGVILPEKGYLQRVRARCTETNTLLVLDEIQTGFGRTGSLFAHQALGIVPDMLILAKALGGGLPLGAVITAKKVLSCIQRDPPLGHISTFGGHPLSCAAGMALFDKLQHSTILSELPAKAQFLCANLKHPVIKELRGMGMLYGVIFNSQAFAYKVLKKLLEKGVISIGFLSEPNGLRISPPLNISHEELKWGIDRFLEAIEEVS
ncbi:MAG: aspartate aminotransferase family protein [Bacteroidota bacterium]